MILHTIRGPARSPPVVRPLPLVDGRVRVQHRLSELLGGRAGGHDGVPYGVPGSPPPDLGA